MNIKYVFRSQQNSTDPILDVSVFSTEHGNLYPTLGSGSESEIFSRNIQLIQDRIDAIQKELSYWDLYKITSKVKAPEELDSVYNDLIIGQSLVIECESFTSNNGDSLHRGDVIVKLSSGDAALVYAVNSGYYYPSMSTTTDNQLQIDYEYREGQPEETSVHYPIPDTYASDSFIYGIFDEISSDATQYEFEAYSYPEGSNGSLVFPIIKFFREGVNNNLEEITLPDYSLATAVDGTITKWVIRFTSSKPSDLNFIQVK